MWHVTHYLTILVKTRTTITQKKYIAMNSLTTDNAIVTKEADTGDAVMIIDTGFHNRKIITLIKMNNFTDRLVIGWLSECI